MKNFKSLFLILLFVFINIKTLAQEIQAFQNLIPDPNNNGYYEALQCPIGSKLS